MPAPPDQAPTHHTRQIKARLQERIDHLRADVHQVEEPQAKALFETTAAALGGLVQAFEDYEQQNEAAWEDRSGPA